MSNVNNLIEKAELDSVFKEQLYNEFLYNDADNYLYIRNKYSIRVKDLTYIRKYFKWTKQIRDFHIKRNLNEKYGVDNISQLQSVKDKKEKLSIEKYGTKCTFQSDIVIEKSKCTKLLKYGDPFYNNTEKQLETLSHRTMEEQSLINSKRKATNTERYGDANYHNIEKQKITLKQKYGVENVSQIPHIAKKKHSRYTIDDINFDSQWELDVYNFCKRNDIPLERNIPIEYEYLDKKHITFIDFRIDGILFEVKGIHLLEGCFDYAQQVPISKKIEVYKENNIILITSFSKIFGKPNSSESNGLKYQHKCPNPLIGVDIELFKNPIFPYRKDRPKCFYDVSVMGEKSIYEAFQDEKLRWEMIINRINYSGGFIDSRQVLNAMNITRKCKQPSWFSKNFAKHIINNYITSNKIIDPFAGWGARCDASIELGKQYIGSDLNDELVEWHKSLDRTISLCNALDFKYNDNDASLFICPPYTDIETYFTGQNDINIKDDGSLLTQCEWLVECIKNCPNCREYVMVCKIVDEGFEKFIVEEKINKSHFGNNKEYILLVTQDDKDSTL